MIPLLRFVPVGASLILGVVYLFYGNARPGFKLLGVAVFLAAVYLQFRSPYSLAGLLLQVGLALSLALWLKMPRRV